MLKGNKGEWSEMYVFLKLLGDGKLNAADANLNAIPNIYYPIIKILRQEAATKREFVINGNIKIVDGHSNTIILTISIAEFVNKSQELFLELKKSSGRSFSFPTIETFLKSIDVNSLSALSTKKSDINVVVHDMNTGLEPTLGFSIKSMLGKDSTLFNPAAGTNFIFKITKPHDLVLDLKKFNTETLLVTSGTKKSKIALRINSLEALGCTISFEKIQSDNLDLNLKLIDSQLPEIISHLVYYKYKYGKSKTIDLLNLIKSNNPLQFDISKGHPFYEYKIKNFLTESALGMTPEKVWTGKYDATGGIIIVKDNGDLVCYHIYNRNEFENYLINHTKFEQASTSEDDTNPGYPINTSKAKPYKYSWVYEENDELFLKLNLQIRFIK